MFLPVPFESVNSRNDLAPGRYDATCSYYLAPGRSLRLMLFEYAREESREPAACDLLVVEEDGCVRARDFVWLPDRSWRDSDGVRSNRLASLLPMELLKLQFLRREVLESVRVGDS